MAQNKKHRSPGLVKAVQAAGNLSKLTERLNARAKAERKLDRKLTVQAVSQWTDVPADRCLEIEAVTGISRYDLRPDIFGKPPKEATSSRRPKTSVQRSGLAA